MLTSPRSDRAYIRRHSRGSAVELAPRALARITPSLSRRQPIKRMLEKTNGK
jgi:hypothetical protein